MEYNGLGVQLSDRVLHLYAETQRLIPDRRGGGEGEG